MTEPSASLPPGTILMGKYRVDREIGCGGMGVVVEATHLHLDQRVAIKLLNPALAGSEELVARFLREARVAANLPSEHVAKVTDVGQTETGAPYLVMELLSGHDLATELERSGTLAVSAAVDLVLQACEGVAEAHAVGLVHRDLKPANLFLARRGGRAPSVKVLDFGLSKEPPTEKRAMALTAVDAVFGTPQYMSPEQLLSAKNVDARSDQHALAMILFELLTGRATYVAPNVTQLMFAIGTQPPPSARALRSEVPSRLDKALMRALAKKPAGRFPDLGGFATAIAPFGGPTAAASAAGVVAALRPGRPPSFAQTGGRAPATDMQITVPLQAATREHSNPDLTSSVDPAKGMRRVRRMAAGALALAVVLGLLAGVVVGRWGRSPEPGEQAVATGPATAAIAATATAAATAAEPSAEPTVKPGSTVEPTASAATSADAPAPAPSSVSSAKKSRPAGSKPGSPKPGREQRDRSVR